MPLQEVGLIIQMCALPATFVGTPQQFAEEMIKRMKILSATGFGRIVFTDVEPTDSQAIWIRGTQIWIFDPAVKRFVPLDISASERHWFWTGSTVPPSSTPPLWLRTASGATIDTPPTTAYGRALGWYFFDGTVFLPFADVVNSGPTAQRPTSPVDLEQYFDTDIATMLIFERGIFRTLAGSPGDIKAVAHPTLELALQFNPGWDLLGQSNSNIRGRVISGATRDQDGSNPLTTSANVPQRSVSEVFGEGQGLTGNASLAITLPPTIAYYFLAKN